MTVCPRAELSYTARVNNAETAELRGCMIVNSEYSQVLLALGGLFTARFLIIIVN